MKGSVRKKSVTTEFSWSFELRVEKGVHVPSYAIVGFIQRDQFQQQTQKNDSFS